MKNNEMNEDLMTIMVLDWIHDDEDREDLDLDGKPYYDEILDLWCQDAHDEKHTYILTAHDGTIYINYTGTR